MPVPPARRTRRHHSIRTAVESVMVEHLEARRMLSVAPAVPGALNGKVVFAHGGHGYVWRGSTTWGVMRSYLHGMMEDHGNVDQLNFFAEHALAAGATVVPLRPVGHQLNEVIVDNASPGFSTPSGTWSASTGGPYWSNNNGNDAASYRFATTASTETAVARFTPNLPQTGFYPVYAWANPGGTDNRVDDQVYRINYTGGSKEVKVATRLVGNGWIYLGNYYFAAGTGGNVEVSNKSSMVGGRVVIADAIRFGNGMGDYDPDGAGAAPVSGQPREEEASLYWAYQSRGWTAPGVRVSDNEIDNGSTTLTHEQINFTAPARWSEYMNNEAYGIDEDRIYLAFHSDASSNVDARGTTALITGDRTPNQARLADIAGGTLETEMRALDSTHEYPWGTRANTLTGGYGEIGNANLGGEMDATIMEVAFHTNAQDAALMKDPTVRNDLGRAATHVAIKYFDEFDPAFTNRTYTPEPPRNLRATTNLSGQVTLAWQQPLNNTGTAGPYGNVPTGYRIWTSTNGYGFDLAATVGNVFSHTFSGLATNAVTYFMVTAVNAGGESLRSWVVGAKPQVARKAPILIVNNYARLDRQGDDIETEYFGAISRVRLRHNNTFDYAVQAAEAIEAYNPALGIDMATDKQIADGTISLANYHTVIWMSGEQSTADETFSAAVQPMVTSFINNNSGRLFVSGSEIGWDLVGQSGETAADSAFYSGTLRTNYVSDDANTYATQSGNAGTALAGVPALNFDDGTHGTYDVDFADVIGVPAGMSGGAVAMNYATGGGAVVQWAAQTHAAKIINMGFPFESIYNAGQRNALMAAVLNYFGTSSTLTTATPTGVDLLAASDTGSSNTDNRTNLNNTPGKTLQFQVSGTVPGATVTLYRFQTLNDVVVGQAVATGETTTITTNGTATLADFDHAIHARQTYPGLPQSAQSTPSLFVRVDTTAPAAPGASTVSNGLNSVTLDWPNNAEADLWGYNVYRSTTSGGPYAKLNASPATASVYTDNTAAPGQTLYYVVRAVDTAGNESGNGAQASGTALFQSDTPAAPDLADGSDSGFENFDNYTNFDNSTAAKRLAFHVGNLRSGATVELYNGTTLIGSALVTDPSAPVPLFDSVTLPHGTYNITARQTEHDKAPSALSPALTVTIDTAAPAAPAAPDLVASSDTGALTSDNYTNDTTPRFVVTGEAAGRLALFADGSAVDAAGPDLGGTTYDATLTAPLADGVRAITARVVDRAGNVSPASPALNVTIDTQAPAAPSVPDLRADTDTGASDSDDLTKTATPAFTGAAEAGSAVDVFVNGVIRGRGATATPGGTYDLSAGPLTEGENAVAARATDLAGNVGPTSSALTVTLDTTAPGVAIAQVIDQDTGSSNVDRTTADNTPTIPANTEPFAAVEFLVDGAVQQTGVADGGGSVAFTAAELADGSHTLGVRATDAAGNATLESIDVVIDTAAPTAAFPQQAPEGLASVFDFTVTYADAGSSLDVATLGDDDVKLVGPGGVEYAATLLDTGVGGTNARTVTYRVAAPGGTWDNDDAGVYAVVQNAGAVADVAGNARPAGTLGTFSFAQGFAYLDGAVLHVEFADGSGEHLVELVMGGDTLDVRRGGFLHQFHVSQFDSVVLHGTGGDDTLEFTGPLAQPVMFAGGAGADQLNVLGGTFTFTTDAAAGSANLGVRVAAGAAVVFDATQHLRDLDVAGSATLTAGGAKVIVTRGLAVAGRLNLTDNDLVLDYDPSGPSPFAAVEALLRAGYTEGTWEGSGIVTEGQAALSGLTALAIGEAAAAFALDGSATATFSGETVDATSVIIKYTYGGDSNFDGKLDADDYGTIDFNVLVADSSGYYNGDFNYDGKIDADDYGVIDFNILAQDGVL